MYFGADYYPEHWGESRWEIDLRNMKKMGFNMVRVAEFAWCRLEPQDGVYDFSWLDKFLDLCEQYGFLAMLGVPVRVVPAWLFQKDPEMAILSEDGTRETFGTRYTTCLSNPTLREYAFRLTQKMAEHYKTDPRVVVWHLDNEYGDASTCYCEACRQGFIAWLKQKYKTLSALNQAWGLAFWSMELTDWDQVWLPKKTNHFQKHPSLLQDYARFTSFKTERAIQKQCEILREITPDKTITTNIQSTTRDHTDYFKACAPIDIVSTNYYPPLTYNTIDLDLSRGLKRKNFWVVEQKSGAPGSQHCSYISSVPGETRMYTYQSIAHGADAILYYRWRPSYFGNEQFYMGILNYDGSENRISREIEQTGKELPGIMEKVEGSQVQNEVALLFSQDSRWASRDYSPTPQFDYRDIFLTCHSALEHHHIGTDIVSPYEDLSAYRTVVAPFLYLADEKIIKNLCSYVEQGGQLIVTSRCGSKDEYARMTQTILPAELSRLFGIKIDEVWAIPPGQKNEIQMGNQIFEIQDWAELIQAESAEVMAQYIHDWYQGYAAITKNKYGKGTAIYLGSTIEKQFFEQKLIELITENGIVPLAQGSADVQVCRRVSQNATYTFFLNTACEKRYITPHSAGKDLLTGKIVQGNIAMEPHEVLILESQL